MAGLVSNFWGAVQPKVPPIKETVPSYFVTPWYGLFAPTGTPESIVNALHAATNTALQDPSVKDSLGKQGIAASRHRRTADRNLPI